MLTAQTKDGKRFCLAYPYNKATLLALRNKEKFFCPVCGERVFLKLGDSRIYHFAHQKGGKCRDDYENETALHLQGKLELFKWLKNQKVSAVMEYYDREIGQRPDILFFYRGRKYALEYQCSPIPESIFQKRTHSYLLHGYTPLWILGLHNQVKNHPHARITNFQYYFLQRANTGQLFLPAFSPKRKTLLILSSIYPYTTKNALAAKSFLPIEKIRLPDLLEPISQCGVNIYQWKSVIEKFTFNYFRYSSVRQRMFLQEIYLNRLNLFLLPPEIGLPVPLGVLFQTPPLVWQLYYYLDVLADKKPGDIIRLRDIEYRFSRRMKAGEIQARSLPQMGDVRPFAAAAEYTHLLIRLGILTHKGKQVFQVARNLDIPQTTGEREQMAAAFYQRNRKILLK